MTMDKLIDTTVPTYFKNQSEPDFRIPFRIGFLIITNQIHSHVSPYKIFTKDNSLDTDHRTSYEVNAIVNAFANRPNGSFTICYHNYRNYYTTESFLLKVVINFGRFYDFSLLVT